MKAKKELRREIKILFGNQCILCGYNNTPKALEFHHINPKEKRMTVSESISHEFVTLSIKEAFKCVLVCKNCHTELEDKLIFLNEEIIIQQREIVRDRWASFKEVMEPWIKNKTLDFCPCFSSKTNIK